MLDVHPPHHPTHTWKDFFIHIATIAVGLLIAVALEQTVEAIHHHHQREELITDFRGECRRNIDLADRNIKALHEDRAWQQAWLSALRQHAQEPGTVSVTLPARPATFQIQGTSGAVWKIAKNNEKAALLPENLAEIYDRVEHENDEVYNKSDRYADGIVALGNLGRADGFEFVAIRESGPVTISLSFAQRAELISALADLIGRADNCVRWFAILKGASTAVLADVATRDAMYPYLRQAYREAATQ